MPGRNLEKLYAEHSYYHVYSRGVNKNRIFVDDEDYAVFLNLFKRYLSNEPAKDKSGREYPWLSEQVDLLAFCLMPNHFHALVYQVDEHGMTQLFKSVITTYGMYFNKKYKRVGPLFQSRFRASMITNDAYLQHISRYIHLNPKNYREWRYSSFPYYLGLQQAEWLQPNKITELFDSVKQYDDFVRDHEDYKESLDEIGDLLAD